jgi:hypothetical protein
MRFAIQAVDYDDRTIWFIVDEKGASIEDCGSRPQDAQEFADECNEVSAARPDMSTNRVFMSVMQQRSHPPLIQQEYAD